MSAASCQPEPELRPERSVNLLARSLAGRCRGATLLVHGRDVALVSALRARRPELALAGEGCLAQLQAAGSRFSTVMIAGLVETMPPPRAALLLAAAWGLLENGGRLGVTVPNGDAASASDASRGIGRRDLTRLLRRFHPKPQLATDQPYRWLTMHVDKARSREKPPHRTRRLRFKVTTRLCRGRVIELGCGPGHLAALIHEQGHEVVGVDISAAKIQAARDAFPGVEFHACDIARLDLPAASFDTAVLAEVLEHVDDELGAAFLTTAWRLLKPGGRLIVSVPNEDCIPHRNHVRVFDRRSLRALLAPMGRPRLIHDQPYKWLMMYVNKA